MQIQVHDVPPRILGKLTADAKRRDVSVNDAVVATLADRYGVERDPTGAKYSKPLTRATLILDMPDELHLKIKMAAAAERGATMRGLVIAALASRYRVALPSAKRRPRVRA